PFRAKDTASDRTEFGHPDVAIILTHLSYYYQGLSKDQVQTAFERLKAEKNEIEYNRWVEWGAFSVPNALRPYNSLNLSDPSLVNQLYHTFRKNIKTINYWLDRTVLPTEIKQ